MYSLTKTEEILVALIDRTENNQSKRETNAICPKLVADFEIGIKLT